MTTKGPISAFRGLALAALLLGLAGCAEVRESVEATSEKLNAFVESKGIVPSGPEAHYEDAMALKARGAHAEAAETFRKAAEAGHAGAAYELGVAHNRGRGVERDNQEAAVWFDAAAARGDPRAQYLVGAALYGGVGVEKDYTRAVAYLGEASVQGHAKAQYLLAEAFANAKGVDKDLAWAARWYGKAARQGHSKAQFAYGVLHAGGRGLPRNTPRGLKWLTIAAKGGHAQAEGLRATLASRATAETLARAEAEAARFMAAPNASFADPPTVMYVQHRLNRLGFDAGPVDGAQGPRTGGAVRAYRRDRGHAGGAELSPELLVQLLQEPHGQAARLP